MTNLKKQTSREVEDLRMELLKTKSANLDEIEQVPHPISLTLGSKKLINFYLRRQGLREEEYSSLAALLMELEQKQTPLDSDTKETLEHLLVSLSNEPAGKRRYFFLCTVVHQ